MLQQELAAVGKRYGYDAGYVQATIYNTASPLHHASVRQRTIGSNKPLVMLPIVRTSVFQFLWARDGDTTKSKMEYFCGIWNRIFKYEDLLLKSAE